MADHKMKIRTRLQDGAVDLLLLIRHPMETGQRTDKNTGEKIPPHFIQKVTIALNDKNVVVVDSGTCVSKDPVLGFRLPGAKNGDRLKVFWTDNMGESGTQEGAVDVP